MHPVLVVALGAQALTSFTRAVIPWPLQGWTKMALTLIWCAAGMAYLGDWEATDTAAAWGLAMAIHKVVRLISAYGDVGQTTVITRATASGRPIR